MVRLNSSLFSLPSSICAQSAPSLERSKSQGAGRVQSSLVIASFVASKNIPAVVKQAQVPRLRCRPQVVWVLFAYLFPLCWWVFFILCTESLSYRVSLHTHTRACTYKRALSISSEKERERERKREREKKRERERKREADTETE